MKTIYQLTFALLTCIGLAACGANSMFEADMAAADSNVQAQPQPKSSDKTAIPRGCTTWFDGCNNCLVKDGKIMGCTKMACKGEGSEPKCWTYDSETAQPAKAETAATDTQSGETTAPETIPEKKREVSADVPANCKIWFDGCNSCVVLKGKLRGCTSKVCTAPTEPSCTKSN